jgi:putative molybdopterin biosynthesis protein
MSESHDDERSRRALDDAHTPRFLSVREVVDYLQLNEKKIYSLATQGKISGTKITGKWLVPRGLVDQ